MQWKKAFLAAGATVLLHTSVIPTMNGFAQPTTQTQLEKEGVLIKQELKRLQQAMADNERQLTEISTQKKEVQSQLIALEKEKQTIQSRIEARADVLDERLRAMQAEDATMGYIDVLLGATSIQDLWHRISAITTLLQADQDLLAVQQKDAEALVEKEQLILQKKAQLATQETELMGMKEHIQAQKNKKIADQQANLAEQEAQRRLLAEAVEKISPATTKNVTTKTQKATPTPSYERQPSTSPQVSASGGIQTVIQAGYKYIGHSVYVFGGGRTASDVANGRFDCSGFVSWAFKQAGVSLPAYTGELVKKGTTVSVQQMQPGDLVFFDTYKKDGHVGIYIGNGKFIGSQSSTGVAIADMSSGYWKDTFNGHVKRIL